MSEGLQTKGLEMHLTAALESEDLEGIHDHVECALECLVDSQSETEGPVTLPS